MYGKKLGLKNLEQQQQTFYDHRAARNSRSFSVTFTRPDNLKVNGEVQ